MDAGIKWAAALPSHYAQPGGPARYHQMGQLLHTIPPPARSLQSTHARASIDQQTSGPNKEGMPQLTVNAAAAAAAAS